MQTTTDSNLDTKLSAIDKALAAAKARKAAMDGADASTTRVEKAEKPAKAKASTQPDFSKQQKKEALAAAREAAKAKRTAEREQRKATKAAAKASDNGKPAHMKKVDRAAERLPSLNEATQLIFNEATVNLSAGQLTALALHIQHFNRVKATERALGQKIEAGVQVTIIGGDPKYIGKTGTVSKAQRIRCYVDVPGVKKPVYLFTSDVQSFVAEEAPAATGTDG